MREQKKKTNKLKTFFIDKFFRRFYQLYLRLRFLIILSLKENNNNITLFGKTSAV